MKKKNLDRLTTVVIRSR